MMKKDAEEINLDGVTYIKKSDDKKSNSLKSFYFPTKISLFNSFKELFPHQQDYLELPKGHILMDPSIILAVMPKSEEAREFLGLFHYENSKIPEFKFDKVRDEPNKVFYNCDYVHKIIKICELDGPSIKILSTPDKNQPLIIESENFTFYLAPRMMEDFKNEN